MWNFLLAFIPRAIVQGIPLLYGSTGEIVTEKSGNLNLGIPGVMYVGAICGVIGSFFYEHSIPEGASMNGVLAIDGTSLLTSLIRDPPKKLPKPTPKVVIARPVTF